MFIGGSLAISAAGAWAGCATAQPSEGGFIQTVTGPIRPDELGRTLIHEHVAVDFIGAAKSSPARYDADLAFRTALPHFVKLRERGVQSLVECTPRYIGRNTGVLRRLSLASGVKIITNTGWYAAVDHKYLPPEASGETADQIAGRWLAEWKNGIEDTSGETAPVRPGFLKLGTGGGRLPRIDSKLVIAAARVHRKTGLTIAVHTGDGAAALDELRLLREEGVAPEALIWVHAMNDPGPIQIEAAKMGAWISLDGYSQAPHNVIRFPKFLEAHRSAGTLGRVLLSHDDGWAVDGNEPAGNRLALFGNGNPAPYESIFTRLIPDLRSKGFVENDFDLLMVRNPREALTVRKRLIPT